MCQDAVARGAFQRPTCLLSHEDFSSGVLRANRARERLQSGVGELSSQCRTCLHSQSDPTGDPLTSARDIYVTAKRRQLLPEVRAAEQLTLKGSFWFRSRDCCLYGMKGNYSPYLCLAGSMLFHCHLWFLFSFSSLSLSFSLRLDRSLPLFLSPT